IPVDESIFKREPQPYNLPELEGDHLNLIANTKPSNDPVQPYARSTRLFNFHSLRPYINDPDYSIAWVSENILNTLQSQFSFLYNRNEGYKQFGFTGIFSGWYPWVQAGVDYTIDRNARTNSGVVYWNELQPHVGLSIPFNFTSGKYFRNLEVGS